MPGGERVRGASGHLGLGLRISEPVEPPLAQADLLTAPWPSTPSDLRAGVQAFRVASPVAPSAEGRLGVR